MKAKAKGEYWKLAKVIWFITSEKNIYFVSIALKPLLPDTLQKVFADHQHLCNNGSARLAVLDFVIGCDIHQCTFENNVQPRPFFTGTTTKIGSNGFERLIKEIVFRFALLVSKRVADYSKKGGKWRGAKFFSAHVMGKIWATWQADR